MEKILTSRLSIDEDVQQHGPEQEESEDESEESKLAGKVKNARLFLPALLPVSTKAF
jgi:hypothetical protein